MKDEPMARSRKRRVERAFTLIELMIVVAIVGILAVLAVYGVRKYLANAKTAEARNALGQIAKDAATSYEKESMAGSVLTQGASTTLARRLCGSQALSIPAALASVGGKKYQSAPAEWSTGAATNVGFACLKFEIDAPQYYMYSYTSVSTTSFLAVANGDLNGDTVPSTFSVTGTVTGGVLNLAPNIAETSPEE